MCLRSFPNSSAGCSLRWIPTIAHYRLHTRVFESLGLVNLVLVGALHLLVLHFFYQPYSFPTMSDATELTPALKRNRITISEPTTVSLASPLTVARAQLRSGLPSLAQSTHTVVQHFFNSLIALWITFSQKKKALQLFENDSFIPTSARLSVELTGSAAIRDTPEFQALSLKRTLWDLN